LPKSFILAKKINPNFSLKYVENSVYTSDRNFRLIFENVLGFYLSVKCPHSIRDRQLAKAGKPVRSLLEEIQLIFGNSSCNFRVDYRFILEIPDVTGTLGVCASVPLHICYLINNEYKQSLMLQYIHVKCQPGIDVMILKKFSPKNSAEKISVFDSKQS
jgi:hypothetical protein